VLAGALAGSAAGAARDLRRAAARNLPNA
ncbi:MAG: hypothetical protein JWP04_2747, partial [Belnapia sp.]|nr:hypothetical protein [Belnapia sp.]